MRVRAHGIKRLHGIFMVSILLGGPTALVAQDHYNAKGEPPSAATIAAQQFQRQSLPFSDDRDFGIPARLCRRTGF